MNEFKAVNSLSGDALLKLLRHTAFAESVLLEVADDTDCPDYEFIGELGIELFDKTTYLSDGTMRTEHIAHVYTYNESKFCKVYLFDVDLDNDTRDNYSATFATYMAHYIEYHC